jgi:hypothetical protein
MVLSVDEEEFNPRRITKPIPDSPPSDLVWSHDGTLVAYNRLVQGVNDTKTKQIFVVHK